MRPEMRIAWTVTGIVVPFLWAAGLTVLGYPQPELLLARGCFILGGAILLGMTIVWLWKAWPPSRRQMAIAISLLLAAIIVPTVALFWIGSLEAVAQSPGGVIQNNQGAPNFNVPGSGNQFNIYPPPAQPIADDAIYQAGVVVGKAYGGRRVPNDATRFEFTEITNCAQFNTGAPFTYGGVRLLFESEKNSAYIVAGRPDSPIRFGVIARVLE